MLRVNERSLEQRGLHDVIDECCRCGAFGFTDADDTGIRMKFDDGARVPWETPRDHAQGRMLGKLTTLHSISSMRRSGIRFSSGLGLLLKFGQITFVLVRGDVVTD